MPSCSNLWELHIFGGTAKDIFFHEGGRYRTASSSLQSLSLFYNGPFMRLVYFVPVADSMSISGDQWYAKSAKQCSLPCNDVKEAIKRCPKYEMCQGSVVYTVHNRPQILVQAHVPYHLLLHNLHLTLWIGHSIIAAYNSLQINTHRHTSREVTRGRYVWKAHTYLTGKNGGLCERRFKNVHPFK